MSMTYDDLAYAEAMGVVARLTQERDRARSTAVALEQEIAACPCIEYHAGGIDGA